MTPSLFQVRLSLQLLFQLGQAIQMADPIGERILPLLPDEVRLFEMLFKDVEEDHICHHLIHRGRCHCGS